MRSYAQKLKLFAGKPFLLLLIAPVLLSGVAGRYFVHNQAVAATSNVINFQARLMNATGSIAPDGDYNVEFKLYNALTSSGSSQGSCTGDAACLWTETRVSTNKVHVANGYVSVSLGSVTSFSSTINWDQQLWLGMNIGGVGSPVWDGEMTPRLQLTAVPYAFRAGALAGGSGANTTVLDTGTPSGNNTIHLPAESGTICIQSSVNCGFVTGTSGSFIQNTTTVQNPGNFAIRSAAVGSVGGLIQGANGQTADLFDLQTWDGSTAKTVFGVNSVGALTLGGSGTTSFVTPHSPGGVQTKINIPLFAPVAAGQILALGLPNCVDPTDSTSNCAGGSGFTPDTARAITVIDNRIGTGTNAIHQPSISVLSPSESDYLGLSWDGQNTNAILKTSAAGLNLNVNGSTTPLALSSTAVNLQQNTTVTGSNTFTVNGGLTSLQNGLTAIGTVQLNVSSNNNTSINTGTSTGTVGIGNSAAGAISLQSGSTIAITTTNFNVSTAGVVTLAGGQTPDITTKTAATANGITLQPGISSAASGTAAGVTIKGGDASGTTSVTGGTLTLQGGSATGASGTRIGGNITVDAGTGDVAANNGTVSIGTTNATSVSIGRAGGNVKVGVLGTATASSAAVCRDTSTNILTACDGTNTSGRAFLQGGNAFSATAVLGTTDANALQIVTGGSTSVRATFDNSNNLYLGNGITASAPSNFTVSATGSSTAGTAGANLKLQGGAGASTSTGSVGGDITIQGGAAGGSGNNAGGNVVLAGGNPANTGAAGKVIVKNAADSTGAFQVQNALGTVTTLDVDTSNGYVGIGTATPGRQLDVAVNNSTVNALPILVEQAGAGDTGVEFKTSSKNFYAGIDNTDGVFKISSAAAANGTAIVGDNAGPPGDSGQDNNAGGTNAFQVTASATGSVSSISVYMNSIATAPNNHVQVAIYSNSTTCNVNGATVTTSPCPGTLLGSSSSAVGTVGWNSFSISGANVTNGTSYWLAISEDGASNFAEGATGTVSFDTSSAYPATSTYGQNFHATGLGIAIYMTVSISGSADNFGGTPLFRMSDTGAVVFQNASNSTNSFQLQNAAGTTMFGVDTTNSKLYLGTNAVSSTYIGSSTVNSVANGTTVLVQGGNTTTAVQIEALASGAINIGEANAANTIQIGSTTLNSGTQVINIGNNNTSGGTTNVTIGTGATATGGTTALQAKTSLTFATNGVTRGTFDTSNNLYLGNGATNNTPNNFTVSATGSSAATVAGANITLLGGTGNTTGGGGQTKIQGGDSGNGAAAAGGLVTIQGGTANGTGASNGGGVTIQGGTASGSGTKGLIQLNGGTYFTTGSYSSASSATITQSLVDSNSAILATATSASLTFTVPSPTVTTAGRILYLTNAGGTNAFTLAGVGGATITLNTGSTTTLIWTGSAWVSADANSLQGAYNNSAGSTTADIILDSTRTGIDIQDKTGGTIGGTQSLLSVRGVGTANTLGASLFTVNALGQLAINNGGTTGTPSINYDLSLGQIAGTNTARTIGVEAQGTAATGGNGLSLTAGTGNTTGAGGQLSLQGGTSGTGAAATGGAVLIQGGTANGSGVSNGGTISLQGGTAAGSGTKGLIQLNGGTYFTTASFSSGTTASITQSLVDSNSAILATATAGSLTFTVPSPTVTAASGRILYVSNVGANPFTLAGAGTSFTLNAGSTATLMWNGSAWTSAGVDASTLQNVYNNSGGGSTPEIILDGTRNGVDIQDSNGGLGSSVPLFAVRAGASSGLGNPLLTVTNGNGNTGAALVGIGTNVATRALDVAVNNSTVNAPPLLVEQSGAGDTAIEFRNNSTAESFYIGQDTSNSNSFSINSYTAAATSAATITHVQSTSTAPVGGATTVSVAYASNTTAGNMLVAVVAWDLGTTSSVTCSDSAGNAWTTAVTKLDPTAGGGNNDGLVVCYAPNIVGGADTVTATFGASSVSRYLLIHEYSGAAKVSPVDTTASNVNAGATGTDAVTSTTSPTSQGGDLIFGATYNDTGSATTIAAGTGFTQRLLTGTFIMSEDKLQASPASVAATNTYTAARRYISVMAAFKAQTSVNDSLNNSLFTLSQTGQAVFKNSVDSSTAFQVQNASTSTVLDVDAANGRVGINTNAPSADLSFGVGSRTINVITQTASNTAGSTLTVAAGAGNGTGAGGTLSLQGGAAGGTAGAAGGGVAIAGTNGTSTGTGGAGGSVTLTGGNAG
ncbi:MAG TPA: hypothetical protein VF466_01010, partial [Candidatus Saccharimonadales bacterium]